jgi:hypothetical protein
LYVVSATWETEVGGSLEPRSLGSVWATKWDPMSHTHTHTHTPTTLWSNSN